MTSRSKEIFGYIGVTFGLTYIIEILSLIRGSIEGGGFLGALSPELMAGFQFAMFIPALVAIMMNQFVYKRDCYKGKAKWIVNYYYIISLEMFVSFVSVSLLRLHLSNPGILQIIGLVTSATSVLGTVLLVALNKKQEWREELKESKFNFGSIRFYVYFGGLLLVFFTIGAFLDRIFNLGVNPGTDLQTLLAGAFNVVVLAPLLGLTTGVFGEEYGWRLYLQDLLVAEYGKLKGVILLGVVWGLWHAPVVIMGWTYPGYGMVGLVVFTFFTTILGVLLSYSVMLSGSIWVSSYIHAINNGYGNFTLYITTMNDPMFNFRLGIFGLFILAVITILMVWTRKSDWFSPEEDMHHD